MHSAAQEKAASPRKRTISRGMSEEESLRHIMKEAEETNRRLTRSDSRYGTLKKSDTRGSQSEEEHAENMDMTELQANYEDCLQDVQSLELQQGVLLFQVDCLQDALEGAEEMLAEAQREANEANLELEREREQRKKLEAMVESLQQEVEQLKEEKKSVSAEDLKSTPQVEKESAGVHDDSADAVDGGAVKRSSISPDRILRSLSAGDRASPFSPAALLSFLRNMKADPSLSKQPGPIVVHGSPEGSSVDEEVKEVQPVQAAGENQKAGQGGEENDESSGYEDAPSEFSPGPSTPDGFPDETISEESELKGIGDPRSPDSCILS